MMPSWSKVKVVTEDAYKEAYKKEVARRNAEMDMMGVLSKRGKSR